MARDCPKTQQGHALSDPPDHRSRKAPKALASRSNAALLPAGRRAKAMRRRRRPAPRFGKPLRQSIDFVEFFWSTVKPQGCVERGKFNLVHAQSPFHRVLVNRRDEISAPYNNTCLRSAKQRIAGDSYKVTMSAPSASASRTVGSCKRRKRVTSMRVPEPNSCASGTPSLRAIFVRSFAGTSAMNSSMRNLEGWKHMVRHDPPQ